MPWKKTETGVVHFISTKSGPWSEVVSEETQISKTVLLDLAQLGGVYLNNCRVFEDSEIRVEDYLRLHTDPRRYPTVPLKERLVFENDDLIVIDKPAGHPCHPTVDNAQENLLVSLQKQFEKPLYLTHRLDVPTSGLLVFAKNTESQSYFHELLKDRRVQKFYEAEVESPGPDLGLYEHYMVKSRYAPKIMKAEPADDTQVCQLRILDKRTTASSTVLRIELLTGRTHQIRAQLGFMGFPILGDVLYKTLSDKKPDEEKISLRCVELRFPWKDQELNLRIKGIET